MAKLNHFFAARRDIGEGLSLFVQTEVEYIFVVARSVYDLLQEVISHLWSGRVLLRDPGAEARRKQHKLPKAFSDMVLKKGKLKSVDDMTDSYGLSSSMAGAYSQAAKIFVSIRDFRERIVHGGSEAPFVFVTEKGFCVSSEKSGFGSFDIWSDEHRFNDHLVSLLPLVAHVVFSSVEVCDKMILAFAQQVEFPPELVPGYRVFVRSHHNRALRQVLDVLQGGSPWWHDDSAAAHDSTV